ncbi:MAG: hypothetical protein EOO13_13560, partial [Chitinophagaceae bacterium]
MTVFSNMLWAQNDNGYSADTTETTIFEERTTEENYVNPDPVTDTSLLSRSILIDKDSVRSWKNRKEFAYLNSLDSLLRSTEQKKESKTYTAAPKTNSFSSRLLGSTGIKIILWSFAILFVAVIVYHLLKSNRVFQRKYAPRVSEKSEEEEELLLQSDFDRLRQQAFHLGDYRTAVRYLFLKTLQQLRDNNHIDYEPDKTNSRYVYE